MMISIQTSVMITILTLLSLTNDVHSWSNNAFLPSIRTSLQVHHALIHNNNNNNIEKITTVMTSSNHNTFDSRRKVFQKLIQQTSILPILTLLNTPSTSIAYAKSKSDAVVVGASVAELQRIQKGHARIQYLLQNWDKLTSSCNKSVMSDLERKQVIRTEGGGGSADFIESSSSTSNMCEKSPLVVQEYLGYKSTTDPLFKIEKVLIKATQNISDDALVEEYLDLVEQYKEKADMSAMMAYTSSWGEANPNGGKDVIDDYLEKTKDDVVKTEILLRKILGLLNLDVLPPSA